jgi:hypothetical protein
LHECDEVFDDEFEGEEEHAVRMLDAALELGDTMAGMISRAGTAS